MKLEVFKNEKEFFFLNEFMLYFTVHKWEEINFFPEDSFINDLKKLK